MLGTINYIFLVFLDQQIMAALSRNENTGQDQRCLFQKTFAFGSLKSPTEKPNKPNSSRRTFPSFLNVLGPLAFFSFSASLRETEPHRGRNVYNSSLVVACLENVMITLFSLFIWNLQVRFIEHIWLLQYRPVRCVCVYRKIHYLARVFHSNQIWVSARAFVALIDLNITDRFSFLNLETYRSNVFQFKTEISFENSVILWRHS